MILTRAVVVLGLAAATACGASATSPPAGPSLVATTSIWADITSRVACGEEVAAIVPAGADPHGFEPSLRDREVLEAADVIVANGGDLEPGLVDLLAAVAAGGTTLVEVATHVDVLVIDDEHDDHDEEAGTHDDEEHGDHDEHDEEAGDHDDHDDERDEHDGEELDGGDDEHGHDATFDPHLWQDPTRVAGALRVIADAVTATGRDADEIERCTAEYRDELLALDAEIAGLLAPLTPDQRVLVTSHESLAYFADRYDLTVVGTVIPSTSTLAETNAADLAALTDVIREQRVRTIFTEQLESAGDAEALAERLDVAIVPLVTDALTDDPASDTYVELLRTNANAIAEGLAP